MKYGLLVDFDKEVSKQKLFKIRVFCETAPLRLLSFNAEKEKGNFKKSALVISCLII